MLPIPLSPLLLAPLNNKSQLPGTYNVRPHASLASLLPSQSPSHVPLGSHISRSQDSHDRGYHLTTTVAPWPRKMPPVLAETHQPVQHHGLAGESGSRSMKNHSRLPGRASSLETETRPEPQRQCEKQNNAPPPPKVPILIPRTWEDVTLHGKGDFT